MRRLARLLPRAVCPVPGRARALTPEVSTEIPAGERLLGLLVVTVLMLALLA